MDTRLDLLVALAVAALGIAVLIIAGTIPDGVYRDAVGPRAFPLGVGILLVAGGAVLSVRRLWSMAPAAGFLAAAEGTEDEAGHPASFLRALAVMAATFAYAALFVPLGYVIATPLYIALALAALGERGVAKLVGMPAFWTLLTYVVFAQALAVRLPVGPLRPLFRGWGLVTL